MKNIDLNDIKVIIFDYDWTLYNGKIFGVWEKYVDNGFTKIFQNIHNITKSEFIKKYDLTNHLMSEYIVKAFIQEFGSAKMWIDYLKNNVYDIYSDSLTYLDNQTLHKYADICPLYVVSNSQVNTIKYQMNIAKVDQTVFKGIYSNDFDNQDLTKVPEFMKIIQMEHIKPEELLVFGDSIQNDIDTAKSIGAKAIYAPKLQIIKDFINKKG